MRETELYVKKKKMAINFCEYFHKETSESKYIQISIQVPGSYCLQKQPVVS